MKNYLLFTLIILTSVIFPQKKVDSKIFKYIGSLGGSDYYVSTVYKSYYEAKGICENNGGNLVCIGNEDEENIVIKGALKDKDGVWIGFTDEQREGVWVWETGERITYTNWPSSEPNNSENAEHCARLIMYPNSTSRCYWNDSKGNLKYLFVLEVKTKLDDRLFYHLGSYNNHDYYVSLNKESYYEAKRICENNGGYLVTISNEDEEDIVIKGARRDKDGVWIGFTDEQREGVWVWETGERVTYTNWPPSEPNNSENAEHYARLIMYPSSSTNCYWNDSQGHLKYLFVIEVEN